MLPAQGWILSHRGALQQFSISSCLWQVLPLVVALACVCLMLTLLLICVKLARALYHWPSAAA